MFCFGNCWIQRKRTIIYREGLLWIVLRLYATGGGLLNGEKRLMGRIEHVLEWKID